MVRLRRDCRIKKDVNRSSYQISILEVWNSFFPRAFNCLAELNSHCKYISCSVFLIWGFLVMRINILLQTSHAWIWKDTWDVLSSKEQLILFDVQGNQLRTYQCHTLNGIGNGSISKCRGDDCVSLLTVEFSMHTSAEKHAKSRYNYKNGVCRKLFFCRGDITDEWNCYYNHSLNRIRFSITNRKNNQRKIIRFMEKLLPKSCSPVDN